MLDEATKKAVVTGMAPPELARRLKLNADRCNTYTHMKLQVLSYVKASLPTLKQGKEYDQEDWHIDHFGETAVGKGKSKGYGKGKKGNGGDELAPSISMLLDSSKFPIFSNFTSRHSSRCSPSSQSCQPWHRVQFSCSS